MNARRWMLAGLALLTLTLVADPAAAQRAQRAPKVAPFAEIRWPDAGHPEVRIGDKWYVLQKINGHPIEGIIGFARGNYGRRWQKRIGEDLAQVLADMGQRVGGAVNLDVVDVATREAKTLEAVPMTEANRHAITHAKAQRAAVADLRKAIDDRWSYRRANDADYGAAIDALGRDIERGMTPPLFVTRVRQILALGIDGHAAVEGARTPRGRRLPFLIEPYRRRFVAFKTDRSGFLFGGHPILTKIDGRPVQEWVRAAADVVPKGSPQFKLRQCLREMRFLDAVRDRLGVAKSDTVVVEITKPDGSATKTLRLPTARRVPAYGIWPRGGSRVLDGGIGYLRLTKMNRDAVREIRDWMPRFRSTRGLVIDVRDNGGGKRDALKLMYSFLVARDTAPRVVNVAAYRLHADHDADHLAPRDLHLATAAVWTDRDRKAIADFARTFTPQWTLPEGKFSAWHYMLLKPQPVRGVFHYDKPIVILMNSKCFSATDVFLSSLKGLPNVTLMGTASAGGSARARSVRLGGTSYSIKLGTMASFQRDGKLFDGNGVAPNVVVPAGPRHHIGARDNQLEKALDLILAR